MYINIIIMFLGKGKVGRGGQERSGGKTNC